MEQFYCNSKKINLEGAKRLAQAAYNKAKEQNLPGAFAVVDDGGNLIYLESWDGTMPAASKIAIDKAATAVGFGRPTNKIEQVILEGRTPMLSLTGTVDYAPLMGGYPIIVKDEIIGGLAVAGALTAENDEIIALTAIKVFENEL